MDVFYTRVNLRIEIKDFTETLKYRWSVTT